MKTDMPTTGTYTVYDGDPAQSGPCNWPHKTGVEFSGTIDDILAEVAQEGRDCGEYPDGDTLWVQVWDANHVHRRVFTVTI